MGGTHTHNRTSIDIVFVLCQKYRAWQIVSDSLPGVYNQFTELYKIDMHAESDKGMVHCFTCSFLEDIFREGEVGGHCEFNSKLHHEHGDHKSPLQSW